MTGNFHEQLDRAEVPLPSDRATGLVFAGVSLIVAFLWRSNPIALTAALALAALLAAISFVAPFTLHPLNVAWMRFALLLSKVVNPIVMLVLFAIAIIPFGLVMQLFRDPLRRRKGEVASYWLPVDSTERSRSSNMTQQF